MRRKSIFALLTATTVLSSLLFNTTISFAATSVVLGWDLVDSGGHMDYTLDSKYAGYVSSGIGIWSGYIGTSVIRHDSWDTVADCDIYDVYEPDETWTGVTVSLGDWIAGCIQLNTYFMDNYSSNTRTMVAAHEIGHTLGCGENDCNTFHIMYPEARTNTSLTMNDKVSVDLARKSW